MIRESNNLCWIEGILNTTNLEEKTYKRDGRDVEYIGGKFTVLVEQEINGIPTESIVPCSVFVNKYKKDGKVSPYYENMKAFMTNFVSIAAAGSKEGADHVRIPRASLSENNRLRPDGTSSDMISIDVNTVYKVNDKFEPRAEFWVDAFLAGASPEVDASGNFVEPARLNVKTVLFGYNGRADVMKFVATSAGVIDTLKRLEINRIYKLKGKIDFSAKAAAPVKTEAGAFGDTSEVPRTKTFHDFVITGGNDVPFEYDFTPTEAELREALTKRKARVDANLEKQKNRQNNAPKKASTGFNNFNVDSLGF